MMLLACPCLNVQLYAKEMKQCEGRISDMISNCGDKQFTESLREISLDKPGITFEHDYLVHRELYRPYKLFQCLSCQTKTHLVYTDEEEDIVLVNTKLESEPAVLERLKNSPNFSKSFKIILLNPTELSGSAPDPRGFDFLQNQLTEIQTQLSKYLVEEEQLLDNRIRQYEEEQKAAYQQLKDQAKTDKRRMISLVLHAAESRENLITDKDMECLPSHDDTNMPPSSPSKNSINKKQHKMRPPSQSFSGNYHSHSPDTEGMFILDEMDQVPADEPFYETDEEEDISPMKTREDTGRIGRTRQNLYSSSVPISVPGMWGNRHHSTEDEDGDEDDTPSDPEQIADRMQALTESITDTGRYIFGDRPRPRINTGEFTR